MGKERNYLTTKYLKFYQTVYDNEHTRIQLNYYFVI